MSKAQGQFTIIDYNDALTLTGYIGSNLAKTQMYNPDNGSYTPDWKTKNLVLTPSLYVIGTTADQIATANVTSDTFCQGCLRTFFAVIQNQTLDFVAHGFFARFTEMDFDAVGGLSDFLYHYRWRGFLYGQRGSGCGGAAVAGVVVHRLSFP